MKICEYLPQIMLALFTIIAFPLVVFFVKRKTQKTDMQAKEQLELIKEFLDKIVELHNFTDQISPELPDDNKLNNFKNKNEEAQNLFERKSLFINKEIRDDILNALQKLDKYRIHCGANQETIIKLDLGREAEKLRKELENDIQKIKNFLKNIHKKV